MLVATLDAWQTIGVPTVPTAGTPPTPVNVAAVTAAVTDAGGHAVRFTVDRWGQPLTATDAVGNVSQTVRNADGLPTLVTSATNTSTQYVYSGAFVTSVTPPSRRTTYFTYGAYGQLTQQYGDGAVLDYFINNAANGRLDSTKTGGQYKTAYVYDAYGRIQSVVDPQNHTTRFTYEPVFGNQDSVQTPLGTGLKVTFDRYGRDSLRAIAGRGSVTTLYDAVNRALQSSDGVNPRATTIAYDGEQPSRVVDPKGQLYKVTYNALGWPVTVYDPADTTRFATLTYTADGLVASRTNREGRRVTVAYDAIHRVTARTDSLAGSTSFGYDALGLRTLAQSRDRSGALIALDSTFIAATGWTDSVVTWLNNQRARRFYHMDPYGRLDTLNILSSAGVDFYSRQWYYNTTTGVIDSLGLGAKRVKLTYNTDGLRTGTDWLAGVSRTESWTAEHRPADATFSIAAINDAFKRSFNYDAQGRINVESRYSNGGNTQRNRYFQFDGLSELQRVQRDSVEYWQSCYYDAFGTYVCDLNHTTVTARKLGLFYDEASNMRQQTDSLTSTTIVATVDAGNRLRNWDGVAYTFDKDGNVTSRSSAGGTTTFAWGGEGQLLSAAAGSDTTYYDYDAQGQVVRRRKPGNVIDRWFLWDQGQLLAELNATATSRLAEYAYDGGVDQPLALITGPTGASVVHWYEQSGHGIVDGLVSATGAVEQTLSYDEWGKLEAFSSNIADSTRLRWKGLYFDGGPAALYYARARWYDPQARRFVSEDPIGLTGGINQFVFGGNDPINMSDPSGLCPPTRCLAVLSNIAAIGYWGGVYYISQSEISNFLTVYRRQEYQALTDMQSRFGGRTGATGPTSTPARTRSQCFAQNTAPVNNAVRSEVGSVVGPIVAGGTAALLIAGQIASRAGTQGIMRGTVDMDIFFAIRRPASTLLEAAIATRYEGQKLVKTGAALARGGVAGVIAIGGLAASYYGTSAAICGIDPNY